MPAFMTWRVEFATRTEAETAMREAIAFGLPGDLFTIHDAPPFILAGLVKGGEYATVDEWMNGGGETLCIAADGRVVGVEDNDGFREAEARGALPITWYHYEAP